MIEREKSWLVSNSVVNDIQSAGREKYSCLHIAFLLHESIAYNLNRGNIVFGVFLDARKALDTVWIRGLLSTV